LLDAADFDEPLMFIFCCACFFSCFSFCAVRLGSALLIPICRIAMFCPRSVSNKDKSMICRNFSNVVRTSCSRFSCMCDRSKGTRSPTRKLPSGMGSTSPK